MLPSISINNTSAAYPESINENNNDEVNGLVQEFKNLFNGKELSLIHISEPTRQAEISYAVFCLKKKKKKQEKKKKKKIRY